MRKDSGCETGPNEKPGRDTVSGSGVDAEISLQPGQFFPDLRHSAGTCRDERADLVGKSSLNGKRDAEEFCEDQGGGECVSTSYRVGNRDDLSGNVGGLAISGHQQAPFFSPRDADFPEIVFSAESLRKIFGIQLRRQLKDRFQELHFAVVHLRDV